VEIETVLWLGSIVETLADNDSVETIEVEEVFKNRPKITFVEKGKRRGEDVYLALGQTNSGRYLALLFIYKNPKQALILNARDMSPK
jgi:uncharacterized DUF497 family protein